MYYTVRGAAKYLGLSRSTVRNRQLAGAFPPPDDTVDRGGSVADIWAENTLNLYKNQADAWKASK